MKRKWTTVGLLGLLAAVMGTLVLISPPAGAHCQIPCGIYNDAMRFTMLEEHITTIEKSMKEINALSAEPGKNANQLVRWVVNKEQHADAFAAIITDYFLQQRIKPADPTDAKAMAAYTNKLVLCHKMLVTVMKTKQTTDLKQAAALRKLLAEFREAYMPKKAEHHEH